MVLRKGMSLIRYPLGTVVDLNRIQWTILHQNAGRTTSESVDWTTCLGICIEETDAGLATQRDVILDETSLWVS